MWRNENILRTNGAINPTYRVSNSTATIRTNLHPNPSFGAASIGTTWGAWYGTGGTPAGTFTKMTGSDTPRVAAGYGRVSWTTAPTSGGGGITSGSNLTIAPSTAYTVSVFVRPSVTVNMYASGQFYNSGAPTGSFAGTVVSCPANQWTRIWATSTSAASDNQIQARFYIQGTGVVAGTTLDADDCLIEATDTLQPYFDGSSKLNLLPLPQQVSSNNGTSYPAVADPSVSHTGTLGSTRFDGNGTSSTIISAYGNGGVGSAGVAVTPGVSYTFSCWVLPQTTVSTLGYAQMNFRNSVGTVTASLRGTIVSIPLNSDWFLLTVTAVAPSDAVMMYPTSVLSRSTGNTVQGQDYGWVADNLLEASTFAGPFYQGLTPAWSGAANASTSVLTAPSIAAVSTAPAPAVGYADTRGWVTGNNSYAVITTTQSDNTLRLFGYTGPAAAPGEYWSGSFEARVVALGSPTDVVTLVPFIYGYNVGGVAISNTSDGATTVLTTSWQRVNSIAQSPMPVGSATARQYIRTQGALSSQPTGGTIIEVRNFVTEKVSGPGVATGPYFDGSTPSIPNGITYRWNGLVDQSTSDKYIPALINPPSYLESIANSTSVNDRWLCDNYDLTTYAFGITKIENSTPEVSGGFTKIPQRNGVLARPNRSYEAGELSLSMWVLGCEEDGSIPTTAGQSFGSSKRQYFERNLTALLKLLGAQNAPVSLSRIGPGQDFATLTKTTRAYNTGSTTIDTMLARGRAELVFTFTLIDSFWTDIIKKTVSVSGAASPLVASLKTMGDAPVDDSLITITGPIGLPTVTCPESGVSFSYNGTLTAGQTLVVDSSNWTAKLGATDVTANISHVGHARFMYIPPREVKGLGLNSNFYPTLSLTGSGLTSATTLKVDYYAKYQVA